MEKIKIIDLLNKIANEEELPKKIRYKTQDYDREFYFDGEAYKYDTGSDFEYHMEDDIALQLCLNDYVEILEEDKKIEMIKVNEIKPSQEYCYTDYVHYTREEITEKIRERLYNHECHIESIERTINKIIDKINGDS